MFNCRQVIYLSASPGAPACCAASLTGSRYIFTHSVMAITMTTHSPPRMQLPANWSRLLFTCNTGRKTPDTEASKYACSLSIKHRHLPSLPTHLLPSSGKILVQARVDGSLLPSMNDAAPSEPHRPYPEHATAARSAVQSQWCSLSPAATWHQGESPSLSGVKSQTLLLK